MSNEPERAYVLSALLGVMTDTLGRSPMGVEEFVKKYKVTPKERWQIARAALHEKIKGRHDDSPTTLKRSVDEFVRREGLTDDDVREAALAVVRGGLENPGDSKEDIVSALWFLVGEGKLIEPEGSTWGFTGAPDYAGDLAKVAWLNPEIAGDLAFCEYDEGNHSDDMSGALPELWQLMRDIGAWKPAPTATDDDARSQEDERSESS